MNKQEKIFGILLIILPLASFTVGYLIIPQTRRVPLNLYRLGQIYSVYVNDGFFFDCNITLSHLNRSQVMNSVLRETIIENSVVHDSVFYNSFVLNTTLRGCVLDENTVVLGNVSREVASSYYFEEEVQYHSIWIDNSTTEIVVNATSFIIREYPYTRTLEIFSTNITNEVFRDYNAVTSIQWTIDNSSGRINISKGTYILNQTIYLDSYTELDFDDSYFILTGEPPILYANGTRIIIRNLNCTYNR